MVAWLDADELTTRLRDGAGVAFDTNVLHQWTQLVMVCSKIKAANATIMMSGDAQIAAVVPALCLAELVLHQRQSYAAKYDPATLPRALTHGALTVAPFDASDAEGVAGYIASDYSTGEAWQKAKRDAMLGRLGLMDAPGKKVPATVDWYIAGHAMARNWILVTDDTGSEFKGTLSRATLDALTTALDRLALP